MPLHDRTFGLTAVRRAMSLVREGSPTSVVVVGPPGTGRSAFLDTVAELAAGHGFAVRRTRGRRLDRQLPFAVAGRLLPEGAEPGAAVRPGTAVDAVLPDQQAPPGTPVAFLVDDLQWADAMSLAWLVRLSADPGPGAPLLLVLAVCEGEFGSGHPAVQDLLSAAGTVVRTGPLDTEGVRAMLEEHDVLLTNAQARAWTRATGGNPALIASLIERLDTPYREPEGLLALARSRPAPWKLRGRVSAALREHAEAVRDFAYGAALLGGAPTPRILARLARLDAAEEAEAARVLLRLGWTTDPCSPPVLWDCVREIAEEGLSRAERTEIHRRAAELLYAEGVPVERIAPHLFEIGPGRWAEAPRLLRRAADEAHRRGDAALAARFLRRALREFPPHSPERGALLAALAEAEQDVDPAAALRHVTQAVPLLRSARERAAVVAGVPVTLFVSAPRFVSEALDSVRGPAAAGAEDFRLEARARLFELGDRGTRADAVERLRQLDPAHRTDDPSLRELVSVLTFAGTLDGRLSAAEAVSLVRDMLQHEPASGASGHDASALMIASGIAAEAHETVRTWMDMALDTARQRGAERSRTRFLGWRALAALHAGRVADAWCDTLDAYAAGPGTLGNDDWLSVLGLTLVADATRDPWHSERLRGLLRDQPDTRVPVRRLALRLVRAPRAPAHELPALVDEILETARQGEASGWCHPFLVPVDLMCVPLLRRLGRPAAALELLARSCDRARRFGSPTALGRVLRLWGTMVQGRYALSLLAESVAVLRESANTLELGQALTEYGIRLRAAGRDGADECLAETHRIADEAGASMLRCWSLAFPDGPDGRVTPPGSGSLGVTERRVAAMAALGRTSQEAAESLGITRRAVEKALTRLYRRLGVAGRAELVPVVRGMAGRAALRSGTLCSI